MLLIVKWVYRFQFEEAAKSVADEITQPRPEENKEVQDIQVIREIN